jgi:uncharacterized membrane protein YhdT
MKLVKKAINKELCQNNLQHVLFASRWIFVQKYLPGNQYTVLAFKIYIDMSGILYPTLSFLACFFYFSTYITVRKLQEKTFQYENTPETVKFLTLSVQTHLKLTILSSNKNHLLLAINSRRKGWVGHVAYMGRGILRVLVRKP